MSLAAILLLGVAPQTASESVDLAAVHEEVLRAERTRLLLDAWIDGDDASRDRIRRTLERLRSPGASAIAPPTIASLTRAWRAGSDPRTDSEEGSSQARLQRFADSLDLLVRPGWFTAASEGKGTPLTVGVSPQFEAPLAEAVHVELWWKRSADEQEALRARREPFGKAAFEGGGFDMYVRAPLGEPGVWHLVPLVERGEDRVWGVPVRVEALAQGVGPRTPYNFDDCWGTGDWRWFLYARLDALERHGLRSPSGIDAFRFLHGVESPFGSDSLPWCQPPTEEPPSGGLPCTWYWPLTGPERVRIRLLVLSPSGEATEQVLTGRIGERWRSAALDLRASLHTARLPADRERVRKVFELDADERTSTVVVVRGDALPRLEALAIGMDGLPFDALIATSPAEGMPRTGLAEVPMLMLAPDGPERIERSERGYDWVHGDRLLLLDDPLLPELARAWIPTVLDGEGAAASGDER